MAATGQSNERSDWLSGSSRGRSTGGMVSAEHLQATAASSELNTGHGVMLPSAEADMDLAQRRVNDGAWGGGRLVPAYANRRLRPVEVDLLVRYRDSLAGRVLELGSGAGRLTGYLAEISDAVEGVDLSAEMVAYSRRHYPKAQFRQGDLRDELIFGGRTWNAIVAPFNVVDVVDDADRRQLLDRVQHALEPGGLFIMSSHNRAVADRLGDPLRLVGVSPAEALAALARMPGWWLNRRRLRKFEHQEEAYAILNDQGHGYSLLHYYITRDAQERQLKDHGFELIDVRDLDGSPVAAGEAAAHCSELHYVARRVA